MTYDEKLKALRGARAKRDEAQSDLYSLRVRQLKALRAQRGGSADAVHTLDELKTKLPESHAALVQHETSVASLIDNLFVDITPETLIEQWSDDKPIMLLPLRVEAKYRDADNGVDLCVRVFPDEIHVTTHEKVLTELEAQRGKDYWTVLRTAATDEEKKDAWRTLADKNGANRAAWVALQTKPSNWDTQDPNLQFPKIELTKPDRWTQAPHSRVLPDRFVLIGYRNHQQVLIRHGKQIADTVVLGPAPLEDDGNPSIQRDANGRLDYGPELKWLFDFDEAVERGLGFQIHLNAQEAAAGYEQLLVLGLKHSADHTDAQTLVEELIDNHHYSAKGFSLVRQGSPTNNTDNDDAAFDSNDPLHEVSYFVETGAPAFTPDNDPSKATDGQRLADALGINYAPLQYAGNGGMTDHAEAVAMNRALYAGTLGYYLSSMLNEVMDRETTDKVRQLFTENVSGRGPLPAIRVGNQPYGVLLTSAFPKWEYPKFARVSFEEHVRRILINLQQRWATLKPQLAHINKAGNARESLMNVLGLQPTSADYYQRVGYSYDYLRNLEAFTWGGQYLGDVFLMAFEQSSGLAWLRNFGYDDKHDHRTPKPIPLLLQLIYRHYHTRLDRTNLIDSLPLSEERTIDPYDKGTGSNYADWLFEHAQDVDALEKENFGSGVKKPNALLYMMLRHALLHETRNSIWQLLQHYEMSADELQRSRKFMNISSQPDVSHWEVFRAPANRILPNEQTDTPLYEHVHHAQFTTGPRSDVGEHLAKTKSALDVLRKLPTARLERLLAEHVDTLNYRLDAWQSALFEQRLRQMRTSTQQERPMGLYLGSYGYLENVRPAKARRVKVPDGRLPAELREGKENLYVSPNNGGYVHTPSLNHATAAAILRSGYLTHATPQERETLAVNLSSERVRRAKYLIDGVRNGQSLEQLLGYLFERGLHDWTTRTVDPVILDHLKPVFRKAFPIRRTKLPRQGFSNEPAETIEDYSVVNGLDLARYTGAFPSSIASLPALDAAQIDALRKEKSNIENSLDALRDILTAECAYQLALGNFDRASAVMQAISGGQLPVEIEVVSSSRGTDLGFTNRVALHFDPNVTANPWPGIAMTARANAEPALNHWIASLLGDPATVRCKVETVGAAVISDFVTLANLQLQPIDVVYLTRKSAEDAGPAEIERRVRHAFATAKSIDDAIVVKIEFANAGASAMRSFAEILPLADAVRESIGKARPLTAQDFAPPSKNVAMPPENPGNIDAPELTTRVANIRAAFDGLFNDLTNEVGAMTPDADALRSKLIAVAGAGFAHAFPVSMFGNSAAELDPLLAQGTSLLDRYDELTKAHDVDAPKLAAMKPQQQVTLLTTMARRFFGDDFVVIPQFGFLDEADVAQADAHRDELLLHARSNGIALPVDEWLHGAALVRPSLHTFATVLLLDETFNGAATSCSPIQLPFRANDTWLGTEFPETTEILHDTISIVQCLPQGFAPASAQAGLLIDEWMEMLPQRNEVTGLAFNFDQPNSVPPAAVLLAIAPKIDGKWTWDELTATVLDTFERAKLRAVEPDMIENLTGFATLIPSTIAEFSTAKSSISLDFLLNIEYISTTVATLAATMVKNP